MTAHYGICSYLIDGDIIDIGGSDCQWMCFIWRDGEDAFRAHQVSEFVEKRHQSCVSTTNDKHGLTLKCRNNKWKHDAVFDNDHVRNYM